MNVNKMTDLVALLFMNANRRHFAAEKAESVFQNAEGVLLVFKLIETRFDALVREKQNSASRAENF
jgi:hypothetical protein